MKVVSLFSGAGGLDLGFVMAGHQIIWANDLYEDAVETYRHNIGDHIVCEDIAKIDASEIPNNMVVTYGLGDTGAEGILPADVEVELGTMFAIPVNRTLYVEGKTLAGWTDGTTTYALGQEVKAEGAEFVEALEILAHRAGIELKAQLTDYDKKRKRKTAVKTIKTVTAVAENAVVKSAIAVAVGTVKRKTLSARKTIKVIKIIKTRKAVKSKRAIITRKNSG